MVWFQCEDCGENLKKPKLPNHFRSCSASKWSCIDCGQIFGKQSVQTHTQCISEAEKYGPKGQGKVSNGSTAKPTTNGKQKPEVDINVGLSKWPPWFCSLCNIKSTSKQTLLLHADGKKHRAKARGFHLANQPPKQENDSTPNANNSTENNPNDETPATLNREGSKTENPSAEVADKNNSSKVENDNSQLSKKRKLESPDNDVNGEMNRGDSVGELGNGKTKDKVKKAKNSASEEETPVEPLTFKDDGTKKIKWKKLIKSYLRSNGKLKMKKLRKLVLESLRQSGYTYDESQIKGMLENKIKSCSRFMVDGKYVQLADK